MTRSGIFIDGDWLASSDGSSEVIYNPATEQPIAEVAMATPEDAGGAVEAASAAFPAWAAATPQTRSSLLLKLADRMERSTEQLAALESANVGKPLEVARDDVAFSVDNLRFFAGAARSLEGRSAGEYLTGHTSWIRREPLGVVAAIAPWNYPLLMAVWKVAPALAVGNTVVLKPSEVTPLTSLKLAELSADILPPGVLNVVTGFGSSAGARLAEHPDVAAVSLTGSVETGRRVQQSAAPTGKKVLLELGGKAPAIIFEDADLAWAAQRMRRSGFYNTGQDCTAATRILVHRSVAGEFASLLEGEVRCVKVGDPLAAETTMGPLVSRAQREKVAGMVDRAVQGGAEVVAGGSRPEGRGYFYRPTVLSGVQQKDEIVQKEIFGPVLTLQPFSDEDEALHLANDVSYALAASVWTENLKRAMRVSAGLQFGTVWINDHTRLTPEMPHGGGKHSGYGRDMSVYSLEEYTQIKHVMVRTQ